VLGQGGTTAEACRRIAVSEQTYYRWRKEYGGLKTDQARRMKDLEKENLRLRRAISDLTLDKLILQEAARDPSSSFQFRTPREWPLPGISLSGLKVADGAIAAVPRPCRTMNARDGGEAAVRPAGE
jgi:transposase-like protein